MPVEAVWGAKYPEPGMIRLSVGFEEYDGLKNIIAKAINAPQLRKKKIFRFYINSYLLTAKHVLTLCVLCG